MFTGIIIDGTIYVELIASSYKMISLNPLFVPRLQKKPRDRRFMTSSKILTARRFYVKWASARVMNFHP